MLKKKEPARQQFGKDADREHRESPFFGKREADKRHDRDSNEKEN